MPLAPDTYMPATFFAFQLKYNLRETSSENTVKSYPPGTMYQFILLLSQHFSLTGISFFVSWLPLWNVHFLIGNVPCLSCSQLYPSSQTAYPTVDTQ